MGKWQGPEWLIFDKPGGMDATQVGFEFKEDGTYTASFGNQNQAVPGARKRINSTPRRKEKGNYGQTVESRCNRIGF
ncbi:MAG: hypothetical protein IPJ82_02100 [Lewinellaceae bacterium]|nr:hypothetical protein [Lewinellaceae bacterium]